MPLLNYTTEMGSFGNRVGQKPTQAQPRTISPYRRLRRPLSLISNYGKGTGLRSDRRYSW